MIRVVSVSVILFLAAMLGAWLTGFWVWEGPSLYVGPLSITFGYGPGAWFPGRYL